jgi:predicted nucleic acid-binding protein
MLSLRLVVDTNVLVSAALNPEGLQRTTLVLAITRPAHLYVSRPILEEYAGVLSRPHLHIRRGDRLRLLQLIKNHCHFSNAPTPPTRITSSLAIRGISRSSGKRPRSSLLASSSVWLPLISYFKKGPAKTPERLTSAVSGTALSQCSTKPKHSLRG